MKLSEQIQQIEQKVEKLSKTNNTLKSSNQSLTRQNLVLKREVAFGKTKIFGLENQPVRKQIEVLQGQLAEEREKPAIKKMKLRIVELQKDLFEATSVTAPAKELQNKLDTVCSEVRTLQTQIKDKDIKIEVQQQEIDSLITKIQSAEEKNSDESDDASSG